MGDDPPPGPVSFLADILTQEKSQVCWAVEVVECRLSVNVDTESRVCEESGEAGPTKMRLFHGHTDGPGFLMKVMENQGYISSR